MFIKRKAYESLIAHNTILHNECERLKKEVEQLKDKRDPSTGRFTKK